MQQPTSKPTLRRVGSEIITDQTLSYDIPKVLRFTVVATNQLDLCSDETGRLLLIKKRE